MVAYFSGRLDVRKQELEARATAYYISVACGRPVALRFVVEAWQNAIGGPCHVGLVRGSAGLVAAPASYIG